MQEVYPGKMIVSFDGNVYCGKTCLINRLPSDVQKIGEYCEYLSSIQEEIISDQAALNTQLRYLKVDKERLKRISPRRVNVLDRSFVSLCAHVWAIYRCGELDICREFLKLLNEFVQKDLIIIPDFFVNITCDYAIAKRRFMIDEQTSNAKRTDPLLIDKHYFRFVDDFNNRWCKIVKRSVIIDTSEGFEKAFIEAGNHIGRKLPFRKNDSKELLDAVERIYEK